MCDHTLKYIIVNSCFGRFYAITVNFKYFSNNCTVYNVRTSFYCENKVLKIYYVDIFFLSRQCIECNKGTVSFFLLKTYFNPLTAEPLSR